MSKITLPRLANLESETTAVQAINSAFELIEDLSDTLVSRDGTLPNDMLANIDMNGKRLVNLPAPTSETEPVRVVDIGGLPGVGDGSIAEIYTEVLEARDEAVAAAEEAASYIGAAVSAQRWTTPRFFSFSGQVSGNATSVDGSANVNFTLSIPAGAITATNLATGAVIANLGYTPVNRNGDTFTGAMTVVYQPTSGGVDTVGFRGLPIRNILDNYVFVVSDCGKMIRHNSASSHAWTIPIGLPEGWTVIIRNAGAPLTIAQGTGVSLFKVLSGVGSNVTLASNGIATLTHEGGNVFLITGTGIT